MQKHSTKQSRIFDIREFRKQYCIGYDWMAMANYISKPFEMELAKNMPSQFMSWGIVAVARLYTHIPRTAASSFSYPHIVGWKVKRGTLIDMNLGAIKDALYGKREIIITMDTYKYILSENILQIAQSAVSELNARIHPSIVGKYGFPDRPEITRLGSITYTSGPRVLLIEPAWLFNSQDNDSWLYVDPVNGVRGNVGSTLQPVFKYIDGVVDVGMLNQMKAMDQTTLATTVWWD